MFGEGWTLSLAPSALRGEGWGEGSFERLHMVTGGIIVNQGAGNSLWFASSGGTYVTPAGDFSTLVQNGNGTYTRTLKDRTAFNFDSSLYETSIVDRNGQPTTYLPSRHSMWSWCAEFGPAGE